MFGSDNTQQQTQGTNGSTYQPSTPYPISGQTLNDAPPAPENIVSMPTGAPSVPGMDYNPPQPPSQPEPQPQPQPAPPQPQPDPQFQPSVPPTPPLDNQAPVGPQDTPQSPPNDELINIKQQALQYLSPLVSHLDQTPDEKFRTTMMMIQASDDQSLVKTAFDAAQNIADDKARAQALLDVINEINYFNQHHNNN